MKSCLDKSGIAIDDVKKYYSSSNEKMDETIIQRFTNCMTACPSRYHAMSIHELGLSQRCNCTYFI
jgi:3-oxoacyl-[acyl-carrier-protein] synthase-3